MSYLDKEGLNYFWKKIKAFLNDKVDKENGKGLSANDYTTTEKNKLASIAEGATKNVVINNLASTSTTDALSAAQGNVLKQMIDGLGAVETVPSYWQAHLDERVQNIRDIMESVGKNKSSFLWWHDAHWSTNTKNSPVLLKYLIDNTAINKTVYGGDVLDSEDGLVSNGVLNLDAVSYVYDWRKAIKGLDNHYSVPGNHDDGNNEDAEDMSERLIPDEFVYAFVNAPEEKPYGVYGAKFAYYIDEPAEKTRYLFLDTGTKHSFGTVDDEQIEFVYEALKSTPAGWHIIPVAHIWMQVDYSVTPATAKGFSTSGAKLLEIFDSYNNRGVAFADCGATVEFCIGGHTHVDGDYTSTYGIPVIQTECDSRIYVRSGLTATAGTIGEQSVNAIIADYSNNVVNVIRVGRGESRIVPINHIILEPAAYTNVLPLAVDANGAVYNGVGYKTATRISTSGGTDVDKSEEGFCATGYIAVKPGDVIRLKNCELTTEPNSSGTQRTQIVTLDSDKGLILGDMLTSIIEYWDVVTDSSENAEYPNVLQFTIPNRSSYAGVAFIRIVAQDINENSIITINEEIVG